MNILKSRSQRTGTALYRNHIVRVVVTILCCGGLVLACSNSDQIFNVDSLTSPASTNSLAPNLARGPEGTVVLSWLERNDNRATLRYSQYKDSQWMPAQTVAQGDNWFVNWADFPSVTPVSRKSWAAHWLVKKTGSTYAYDVAVSVSNDSGESWSEPITPHTDNTATEHGFVSLFPTDSGSGALWLDGRNMTDGGHGTNHHSTSGSGGMTLRSAVVEKNGNVVSAALVDELVCDCCQTDVALSATGPVAVYRNRSDTEVRDIYVTRSINGQWLEGQPVAEDNWEIAGCPVNGPAIAADGRHVAVAWFTAASERPIVKLALSQDGAATFAQPVIIDNVTPLGRVDVEIMKDGVAAVSWMRKNTEGHVELSFRLVSSSGQTLPMNTITKMSGERSSGFPQMIRHVDELLFAWTDTTDQESRVKTKRVEYASSSGPN